MCFSTLAPHTPTTESGSNSPTQPLAALSSQLFAAVPENITVEGSTRKRVGRACEVCRRKKVKCNGQKPCNQCIAFAEECNYVDVKDRSAYSRRYVEGLEARLARVESTVAFLMQDRTCDRACEHGQVTETTLRQGEPGTATEFQWQRQFEQADRDVVPRYLPSADALQAQLGLEYSIDLTSLSATHLIEQSNTALRPQEHHSFPSDTSFEAIQVQTHRQAPPGSTFQPQLDLKREVGDGLMAPRLPSEVDFFALLDSYTQRVYPFCSVIVPSEANAAWIRASSAEYSLPIQFSSEVALVFAIMACGAQACTSSHMSTGTFIGYPNTTAAPVAHYSSRDFEAHALAWAQTMEDNIQQHPPEAPRQVQLHALMSFYAAGQGDSMLAFDHIVKARSLLVLFPPPEENHPDYIRLSASIELLDRNIRNSLGRMATQQQSVMKLQSDVPIPQHGAGLFSALHDLSTLCTESGSVGRTIRDLLAVRSHPGTANELKASAQDRDRLLLEWYNALPDPYRSTPSDASDGTSTGASCIAFVALQFERVRLHLALQHFTWYSGASAAGEQDGFSLARCLLIASETIQKFPTIAKYLHPSPWLVLYTQCLGASAAFLILTAVRKPHSDVSRLLIEVEKAVAGLEQLEHIMQGIADIRTKLVRLVGAVKTRSGGSLDSKVSKKKKAEEDRVDKSASVRSASMADKRIRAATLPQVGSQVAVSPIPRAETAPPVPLEQLVATSLSTPSNQALSGAMSVFSQPVAPPSVPMQWSTNDGIRASTGDVESFSAFCYAPTSSQPQYMAGLLGDYMFQDQHSRRQVG
ncbi:hypothetical protein [Sporisorium scitamineum]|uniref:Zn(2)-C6 fungal-type domain-containing protein n=1 Tax=Sporisorium scitamineum TaxID=49012 RepID=A0A0F7RWG8_9BASI|nr:hypothetical protein [Sporisorium scitamineum]